MSGSPMQPLTAVRQAAAVARLQFSEAVRRGFLIVPVILAAGCMAISPVFPTDGTPEGRIRLAVSVCTTATAFASMLVTLLVGASSLSEEIRSKRIFLPAVKPVSRATYLAGKYLGTLCVGATLAASMAVATVVFVRLSAHASGGGDAVGSVLVARREMNSSGEYVGERPGLLERLREVFRGRPRARGEAQAAFVDVPPGKATDFSFQVPEESRERNGSCRLRLTAWSGLLASFPARVEPAQAGSVPGWEGASLIAVAGRKTEIAAPAGAVGADGRLALRVFNTGGQAISISRSDGLVLAVGAGPFELNMLKWTMLLVTRVALIAAAAVGFSSFMSFPVAAFAAGALWIGGYLSGFALEVVKSSRAVTGAPAGAEALERGFSGLIAAVCGALPDFAYYSCSMDLTDSKYIAWGVVLSAFVVLVVIRGSVLAVVSAAAYRRRELGA